MRNASEFESNIVFESGRTHRIDRLILAPSVDIPDVRPNIIQGPGIVPLRAPIVEIRSFDCEGQRGRDEW